MIQSAPLLSVRSLRFSAGKAPILTGVDFDLRAGEFVGLIGANGAGKTTLLRVVSGLWPGASGEVLLLGRPLRDYSTREVARIVAHVPQSTRVDFAFTARDVVLMGRSPHLSRFQVESARDRSIAERALRTTGTLHLADRLVTTLSGGELQRVVLARALAQEPRVLLLDEPTSNLDIRHQVHVLGLARDLARETGLGVLAAIHDIGQAARYCDRLVMMMCGRIVADGPPDAVLTPERLAQVFEIEARLYRDPYTGHIALSLQ